MSSSSAAATVTWDDLGQVALRAQDLDRAVRFYRDVLGMPFLFQAPPGLAFFRCGSVTLMLSRPERAEFDHPGSVLYFRVPDLDAAYAALVGRGVRFESEPHPVHREPGRELRMALLRDSEGNPLALMAWVPVA
ncbi:MAG TPA: VOC family protein [Gemmatimonadales bacterium]|jgi:methylmalonyl-CoA/ethylmalonyl-CoA epimerase|nr:VOC family protein [Gemmatimonadales bacterium]